MTSNNITTSRDVEASRIPSGEKITIPGGTPVVITQALGGSYTVLIPSQAGLFRIEGNDADAIGHEVPAAATTGADAGIEQAVWDQLRTCFDPEIPVNIVDLGLIYGLEIKSATEGTQSVNVQMTLTAPGCGMGPIIAGEARQKILALDGIDTAEVELVWDPPWSPDRISEAGKQKLGMV